MGTFFVCAIFGLSLIWRLSIDRKWSGREKKWWDREKCPNQVSKSGHSARNYAVLHAGADYLPAIVISLKRTNISVITMLFYYERCIKRQLACKLFKKSLGLAVLTRLCCSVYSQARSHYWSTRGLWPAPSPTWAGSPLLRRPGDPELPQEHHIDTELSATPDRHSPLQPRSPELKRSASLSLPVAWITGAATEPGESREYQRCCSTCCSLRALVQINTTLHSH